jgi:dihydrofolate reductase/uncharacterized protein YndB with AHSA1/START domain
MMGKLIITEYISLDGVVEAPGGGETFRHAGWTFTFDRGDEGTAFKLAETRNTAALLFGRVTFEGMAAVWPHMTGDFADIWNTIPKYVVSSTLTNPDWNNSYVLSGDLRTEITQLVEQTDGDIVVHGSPQLAQSLLALGLVDELRLMTFPIVLGSGKRLFTTSDDAHRMNLTSSTAVGDGIVISTYTPVFDYQVSREMTADVATVWRAWTDPTEFGTWFHADPGSVELDVRPGGRWHLDQADEGRLGGTYIKVAERQMLVMSTEFASGDTVMEMTFHPVGDRARVAIRQTCTSRAERDGARLGSEVILGWCSDHLGTDR